MKRVVAVFGVLLGLAVLAALGGWFWVRASALDAAELEARLMAVPAHVSFREVGVRRTQFTWELEGEPVAAELAYVHVARASGTPASRPIVLIHGTPDSSFAWNGVLFGGEGFAGLAEGAHDVFAIDVLGHGITTTVLPKVTFQRCADWVAAGLRALGLDGVCLVGQSYGGEFAWRVALDHPELVDRLVLIDSSGWPRREGGWLSEEVQMREHPLANLGWMLNSRDRVRSALDVHYGNGAPDHAVETFYLCCARPANWFAMIDLVRDENGERAEQLDRLSQPTLLLWGERDLAYPVEVYGTKFVDALPNARLEVVDGAGHYPHVERAQVVAEAVRRFAGS